MQKLLIPLDMRGYQRVFSLEQKIFEAAVRDISPVMGPLPVKYPLPDPQDSFSLKPGSLASRITISKALEVEKTPNLMLAIDSARGAASQFSKKPRINTTTMKKLDPKVESDLAYSEAVSKEEKIGDSDVTNDSCDVIHACGD